MPNSLKPRVFVGYSRRNNDWLQPVRDLLEPLVRAELVTYWDDTRIRPGDEWNAEIRQALATATVGILLVSREFFASDYVASVELPALLEAQRERGLVLLPVVIRPCSEEQLQPLLGTQMIGDATQSLLEMDEAAQERAWMLLEKRIREELAAAIPDPGPQRRSICQLPHEPNPYFAGREPLLQELRAELKRSRHAGLTGLGGLGKTEAALEYSHRYRENYHAIFWLNAETRADLDSGFAALAADLCLCEATEWDPMRIVAAVQGWLAENDGWLLVLDKANNLELAREYAPRETRGHILLTTRAHAGGVGPRLIPLETLQVEDAADFLLRRAGILPRGEVADPVSAADRAAALELARALGGLPLALDQAGAYMEEQQCGPGEYLEAYLEAGSVLRNRRGTTAARHECSVAATFTEAFERLERESTEAADLLRVSAFLSPDGIPEEIFEVGATELGHRLSGAMDSAFRRREVIGAACRYSLVRRDVRNRLLLVHKLVQETLRDQMFVEDQRKWAGRAVDAIAKTFPWPNSEEWSQCARLLPTALAAADLIQIFEIRNSTASSILGSLLSYLRERWHLADAYTPLRQGIIVCDALLEIDPLSAAFCLRSIADLLADFGFLQAEPLYRRVLTIREKALGAEHLDTAVSLNSLASLLTQTGRYAEAERLYRRANAIREATLGSQHPDTAASMCNLATLLHDTNRKAEAMELQKRALAIRMTVLGPEHPATAQSQLNIGRLLLDWDFNIQAEAMIRSALATDERVYGPTHPYVAVDLRTLAGCYRNTNRTAKAKDLETNAKEIEEANRAAHTLVSDNFDALTRLLRAR